MTGRTVLHVTHDTAEAARLGHRVLLMTEEGITAVTPHEAPPPRPYDAPDTGDYSISDLAELFDVSRPTIYRVLRRVRSEATGPMK